MGVAYLDDHTRVLGEENLHHVDRLGGYVVEVDMHAALLVGKHHLQQGGDDTTGRHVVASHDPTLLNEVLHGVEAVGEIFGVLHGRHIRANLTQGLGEGRATEALCVEREVDVIQ